ncbi:MAG: hypothetical protein RLZZ165_2146, partial [Bacteroidota bacterium]
MEGFQTEDAAILTLSVDVNSPDPLKIH